MIVLGDMMSKLNIKKGMKKIIAGASIVLIIGGSSSFAYRKITSITPKNDTKNKIGHSDVVPILNKDVKENEFVLLDVGNHNSNELSFLFQNDKIKFCNKNDISLGIIINSNATKQLDIYNDIEYAKKIVSEYKIGFPVYFSINKIMENDDLNATVKSQLIKDFAKKATDNGMYFGICGTDTNLYNLDKYCFPLKEYDVYLKKDSEKIKYEGKCNVIEDENGNIKSCIDLSTIIKDKNLNQEENFVQDAYYIVDESDTVDEIALKFGLSVNDLLEFNNKSKDEIKPNVVLRIPNNHQIPNTIVSEKINEKAIRKGVDLSYCQTKVDWEKLSSNVDYAILKVSEGTREDNLFDSHITNCLNNGIDVGVYSITRATTVEDVKKEAENIVELLKNRKITYPVYLDFEANPSREGEWARWCAIKDSGIMTEFLTAWSNIIKEAGYTPGIYCNKSIYLDIYNQTNSKETEFLNCFETWIAGTKTYSKSCDYSDIKDPTSTYEYNGLEVNCNMRQVSEACKGIGAANGDGYVDFNYCYTDYETKEYEFKYEFDIKDFNKEKMNNLLKQMGITTGGLIVAFVGAKVIIAKKKRKNKENNRKHRR